MYTLEPTIWVQDAHKPWYKDWRALAGAMVVSCIGVLVRSIYRTIELSEGYVGFLSSHEVYFYVLDFVPLIVALLAYIPFWPGRFIPHNAPNALINDAEEGKASPRARGSGEGTLNEQSAEPKE
jgi:hypothetical protein